MILPILLAIRPKTLTAAVVPVAVGSAVAVNVGGMINWGVVIAALTSSVFIQIATNLFNDAIDYDKGADTAQRLGPTRVTQAGLLPARTVYFLAAGSIVIAAAFGVPLLLVGGWPIALIGVVSLFLAYAYTGGPFPLAYKGLGELFVLIFFGWIAVMGVTYLHLGTWRWEAFLAGSQVGLCAAVLIAINNTRDMEGDRQVGKMTLAARFGLSFARFETGVLLLTPLLLVPVWSKHFHVFEAWLAVLSIPLAWGVWRIVSRDNPGVTYNRALAIAAAYHLVFGGLLTLGLVL